jgi:hypothetical protein
MIKAIAIDRTIPVGEFSVRAETLTIDDEGFEFVWSVSPVPVRPDPVLDPDSGRTRIEQFFTPLSIWWSITDGEGRHYVEGGGSAGGDSDRWRSHTRYLPTIPSGTPELVLTLSEIVPRENVAGSELETIRVSLAG